MACELQENSAYMYKQMNDMEQHAICTYHIEKTLIQRALINEANDAN